jgi:hypothetical protein
VQLAGGKLPNRLPHSTGADDRVHSVPHGLLFQPTRVPDELLATILPAWKIRRAVVRSRVAVLPRRFPPPWSVDDPDTKLGQDCFIVRDANSHALAYVYFEDEPG